VTSAGQAQAYRQFVARCDGNTHTVADVYRNVPTLLGQRHPSVELIGMTCSGP
jgi:hypothetical protein